MRSGWSRWRWPSAGWRSRCASGRACRAERALAALAELCTRQFGARPGFALCAHLGVAALGESGDEPAHPPAAAGPAVREAQQLARAGAQAGAHVVVSLALLRQAGAEDWARSRNFPMRPAVLPTWAAWPAPPEDPS